MYRLLVANISDETLRLPPPSASPFLASLDTANTMSRMLNPIGAANAAMRTTARRRVVRIMRLHREYVKRLPVLWDMFPVHISVPGTC